VNEAGHRQAAEQLRSSRSALDPVADIRLYTEATHGMAIHLVAAGFWRRHGVDVEQHQGMVRRLRDSGYTDAAESFAHLERIRTGRWYGGQGNGDTVQQLDELLAKIEEWSLG
jgi:hypothetical protein